MAEATPTAPESERLPFLSFNPVFIGLRYLLRKKLCYLAIFGVALSVGTILVVLSVFTGFQLQFTSVIRGYLSDLSIRPVMVGEFGYGMRNWEQWRRQVIGTEHVEGVAPFLDTMALLRLPGQPNFMSYVQVRGVDPELEGTVSKLPQYMEIGQLSDLNKTFPNPAGGQLRACLVGNVFPGIPRAAVRNGSAQVILITATKDLERELAKFTVDGMFKTGNNDYDSQIVIMSLDAAEQFAKSNGAVTGLNVRLDDYHHADAVRAELEAKFQAGRTLRTFDGAAARRVTLSSDGSLLATVSDDGQLVLYEVATGKEVRRVPAAPAPATVAAISDDGAMLLVGRADGSAELLKARSGEEVRRIAATSSRTTAAAFSSDAVRFALGREDGTAAVFEVGADGGPVALEGHTAAVNDIAFSADGDRAATASGDGTARVWDAEDGRLEHSFSALHTSPVTAVAFSPGGDQLLMGQADGVLLLLDLKKNTLAGGWPVEGGAVLSVLFGPANNSFMTATPGEVRTWEVEPVNDRLAARTPLSVSEPGRDLRSVAFAGNGQEFISVAADGVPRLRYSGPQFSIKTWEQQNQVFMEAVGTERFLQALILSLILVLAEFFIFALVATMVSEKRRDIGILKALGFTSRQVSMVFLVIGLSIGVFGGLLGVGGGILFAHNINAVRDVVRATIGYDPFPPQLYYFTQLPSHVTASSVIAIGGGAIICALLFSIIPAIHAARMDPVRTLHYE